MMTTEKAALSQTHLFENRDDAPASPMSKSKRAQKIAAARSRRRVHSSHYSQGYGSVKNIQKDHSSSGVNGHFIEKEKPVHNDAQVGWPDEDNRRMPAPKCVSAFPVDAPGKSAPQQQISEANPKLLETHSSSSQRHGVKATSDQTFSRAQKRTDENTNPSRDKSPVLRWPIGDDSPSFKKAPSSEEILDVSLKRSLDDASVVLEEERSSSITSSSSSLSSAELSNIAKRALLKASEKSNINKPSIERPKRVKAAARLKDDDDNQSVASASSRRSRYEKLSAAKKRTAAVRRKYEQRHASIENDGSGASIPATKSISTKNAYLSAPGAGKRKKDTRRYTDITKDYDREYSEDLPIQKDIDDEQLTKTVQSIIANALENPKAEMFSQEAGEVPHSSNSGKKLGTDSRLQSSRSKTTMHQSGSRTSEVKRDAPLHSRTTKSILLEDGGVNEKEMHEKTINGIPYPADMDAPNAEGQNSSNTTSTRQINNGKIVTAERSPFHSESFNNEFESKNAIINIHQNSSKKINEKVPKNDAISEGFKELESRTEIGKMPAPTSEKQVRKNAYLEHLQKQKNNHSKQLGGTMKRLDAESSLSSSGSSSSADESMQNRSKIPSVMGRINQRVDFVHGDDSSGERSEKRGALSGEEVTDEDESIRGVRLIPSHMSLTQADEAAFDGQFMPSKFLQTREEFEKKSTLFREEITDDGNNSMQYSSADESSFKGTNMQYSSADESTLRGAKFLPTSTPSSTTDESALVGQFIPTKSSYAAKNFEKKTASAKETVADDSNNNMQYNSIKERKDSEFVSPHKQFTQSTCAFEDNTNDQFNKKSKRIDAFESKSTDMELEEDNDCFSNEFETSSMSQASDALEFWEKNYAFNQDDDVNRIVKKALSPSAAAAKSKTQWSSMDQFDGTKEKSQPDSSLEAKLLHTTSNQLIRLESQIGTHPWTQQGETNQGSYLPADGKKSGSGSDDDSQFSGSLFSGLDESTFRSIEFAKASKPFQGRDPLALTSKSKQPFDMFPQAPPPPPPPPPRQGQGHCGEVLDESELLATVNSDITSSVLAGEGTHNAAEWTKRSSFVIKEEASDDITTEHDPLKDTKSLSPNNMSGKSNKSQRANIKPLSSNQSPKSHDEKSSINAKRSGDNHPTTPSSHSQVQESDEEEEAEEEGLGDIFMNFLDSFTTFCRSPEPNTDGKSQVPSPVKNNDVAEIQSVNTATGSVMSASQATMNEKEAKKWDDWDRRDSHTPTFADGSTIFTNGSVTFTDGDGTFADIGSRFTDGETILSEGESKFKDGETTHTDGESKFTLETELTKRKAEAHEKLLHYRKGALMENSKGKRSKGKNDASYSSSSPSPSSSASPSSSVSENSEAGLNTLLDISKAAKSQNLLDSAVPLKSASRSASPPMGQSNANVFSLNQRRIFEKFCKSLRTKGVEVLKQNRDGKWQVRYLTFSRDETDICHVKLSHDDKSRGHCPTALLWVKRFSANKDHSISLIDKQGRGGVILANIVKVAATGLTEGKFLLPKKYQAKYSKSVVIVIEYNLNGSVRSMALRCKNTSEAHFICSGLRVCMDVLQREREGRKAVAAK